LFPPTCWSSIARSTFRRWLRDRPKIRTKFRTAHIAPRNRFNESKFRPKTFRANSYPYVVVKISQNSGYKFVWFLSTTVLDLEIHFSHKR
jgi:hypothetical protein